jgi:hypothetical protein
MGGIIFQKVKKSNNSITTLVSISASSILECNPNNTATE